MTTQQSPAGPHVLIVGAGSTGLIIAQGLKRAGIPFTIFEARHDASQSRDWSMGLHWSREMLSQILPLDVLDRFSGAEADASLLSVDKAFKRYPGPEHDLERRCFSISDDQETHFPFVNLKTGELITEISGKSTRRVRKSKLVKVLSNGIDIKYGAPVKAVGTDESGAFLTFADGETSRGNIIVGCDGSKSIVRSSLLDPAVNKLEALPALFFNFQASFPAATAQRIKASCHPIFKLAISPTHQHIMIITVLEVAERSDPASWIFQLYFSSWHEEDHFQTSAERVAYLKQCAWDGEWADPFRSAALELDPEKVDIKPSGLSQMPDLQRFDNCGGQITLAGDAAHTMSPHRGQGLNNAIQDALEFVQAIKHVAQDWPQYQVTSTNSADGAQASTTSLLKNTITSYDEEVWLRGKKEIDFSAKQTAMAHDYNKLMESPLVRKGINKVPAEAAT